MMNKLGLIIVSVILALIQTGCTEQSTWMSLNSSNPRIIWEVKPQADLENITGEQISTPEFKMSDYVKGVVPGQPSHRRMCVCLCLPLPVDYLLSEQTK